MSGHPPTTLDPQVRLEIYRTFLETGEPPKAGAIAATLGLPESDVRTALERLASGRAIVLRHGTHDVLMAAPFSAEPTRFRVEVEGRQWWANCVWDALGIPAMLGASATISARCGDCDEPLSLRVVGGALGNSECAVHFAVPAARWWEDIVFT